MRALRRQALVAGGAGRAAARQPRPLPPEPQAPKRSRHDSPIFVAIDTPDLERAPARSRGGPHHAGGVKLGPRILLRQRAARRVREIAELGLPIFLDLKLHDIPNTVAKAVQALAPLNPAILTVHAPAAGR